MNELLRKRCIEWNWVSIVIALVLIGLLFLKQILLDVFLLFVLSFVVLRQTYYFLPLRYNDDDGPNKYFVYDLLPVPKKIIFKYNLLNALFWSFISLSAVIVLIYTLDKVKLETMGFLIRIVIFSSIPVLYILFDTFVSRIKVNNLILTWLIYYICMLSFFNTHLSYEIIAWMLWGLIVLIGVHFTVNCFDKHKYNPFFVQSKNKWILINNMTKCQFKKTEGLLDGWIIIWSVLRLVEENVFSRVLAIVVLNLGLVFTVLNRYFSNENLIRLVPVSFKEKKLCCNIFMSAYLFLLNALISVVLMFHDAYGIEILLRNIFVLTLFSITIYAIIISFYHRNKNGFVELIVVLLIVLSLCFLIVGLQENDYFSLILILCTSFILLFINYKYSEDTCR